jgi:SAM-dependent methyltransferase
MDAVPIPPRVRDNGAIVDDLVDEAYLQRVDSAWAAVAAHSRRVLNQVAPEAIAGSSRSHALEWLRVAAARKDAPGDLLLAPGPSAAAFELAAAAYPSFLAGESNGTSMMFAGHGLDVWQQYYQSANPHYAPLNQGAAAALAARGKEGKPLRVLEVGAGTGGATSAALAALRKTNTGPVSYLLTDVSVRLLRMTETAIAHWARPDVVLEFERYDLDSDRPGRRVASGGFDVVLAVNALHNATGLVPSLQRLCALLREGGVLIVSESICGAGQQVHQEFFLNLLPMPDHRRGFQSRFLSGAAWRQAIREAGLEADIATNSIGPELVVLASVTA